MECMMRKFTNMTTAVVYEVAEDKVEWYENEAGFEEFFDMPEPVIIKPAVKKVAVKKAKVEKKVLK